MFQKESKQTKQNKIKVSIYKSFLLQSSFNVAYALKAEIV